MKGAQNPMRGIYRRGSIYWLARQVDKKRHFVSLETNDPVEALGRAEKIRTEGVLETGTILCQQQRHDYREVHAAYLQREQESRLQARLDNPEKWWKFSPSDLKERAFWDDYQEAYEEAINRCSTDFATWHVVPANRKWARDLAVIELLFRVLKRMDPRYPKPTFDPKAVTINPQQPVDQKKLKETVEKATS